MGQMLKCVSPIDGSVFAEREVLSREAAFAVAGPGAGGAGGLGGAAVAGADRSCDGGCGCRGRDE